MFRGSLRDRDADQLRGGSTISPKAKTVDLRNVATGEVTTEPYDKLVLSPGAASVRPPLPGIDLPGIFQVRTVPDVRQIRQWIERGTTFLAGSTVLRHPVRAAERRAVVVGGGFIGLEMAENLSIAGLKSRSSRCSTRS